jgi:hypothetical protein
VGRRALRHLAFARGWEEQPRQEHAPQHDGQQHQTQHRQSARRAPVQCSALIRQARNDAETVGRTAACRQACRHCRHCRHASNAAQGGRATLSPPPNGAAIDDLTGPWTCLCHTQHTHTHSTHTHTHTAHTRAHARRQVCACCCGRRPRLRATKVAEVWTGHESYRVGGDVSPATSPCRTGIRSGAAAS